MNPNMNQNIRVVYTQEDGTVAIVVPTPEFIAKGGTFEQLIAKSVPKDVGCEVYDASDIPNDRYFRNAWKLDSQIVGQGIEIDRSKAESIHLDKLRKIRDEKLKAEDIEYLKALELNDRVKIDVIVTKRQALRDMPQTVDFSGLTLDELKDFIPDVLK